MKNLNNYIEEKFMNIVMIFLFIQPLIDLFTSIFLNVFKIDFTIGIIVRVLFLIFLIYYYVFVSSSKCKKRVYIVLSCIFIYLSLFTLYTFFNSKFIIYDLQNIIKFFYFPISLILLYFISFDKKININDKDIFNVIVIYLILIIIPSITNISFNGYAQGKIGVVGWFNSVNEISAILSITMPIFMKELLKQKLNIKIVVTIIYLYVLFNLGSKIVILSLFITIMMYILKLNYEKITIILLILLFLGIIFIPKTSFYKNIKIHSNFLGINNVNDLLKPNMIDRFIFSDRLTFLNNTINSYSTSNNVEKIIGIGYSNSIEKDKLIEMDIFDILFRCGILGFIIYFSSIGNIIKKVITIKKEDYYLISLLLIYVLTMLTGHVLSSPSVSIFIVFIFLIILNDKEILE